MDQRAEVTNPATLEPKDPESAEDSGDLNSREVAGEVPTPAGPAKFRVMFDPDDPVGRALAALPAAVVGIGWMLAAGWVFGRAIETPPALAIPVALVPGLSFVAYGPVRAAIISIGRSNAAEKNKEG